MNALRQTIAVIQMNLNTVPRRLGTSLVIVIGVAGVVAVLVSVLAMATGFLKTMNNTGRDDRALVLRAGAVAEMSSIIQQQVVDAVTDAPGVKRDAQGKPVYSAELLTLVLLTKKDGGEGNAPLRGAGPGLAELRPELKIVSGRMFTPGLNEVIIGRRAQELYRNLNIGSEIARQNTLWKIVGVFESNGDVHESEILTSNATLQSAINWPGQFRAVEVMLDSSSSFATFKASLASNPRISVDVVTEREYLAEQSKRITSMLGLMARFIGGIMALGAIFGALNSMYSAISTRSVEIATLRAIGFGPGAILVSVMTEALLLALVGGAIGALLSWLFFNGYTVSTSAVGSVSAPQTRVFNLLVTADLMFTGIVWALIIGLVGGLLPAVSAARLPVATALRRV